MGVFNLAEVVNADPIKVNVTDIDRETPFNVKEVSNPFGLFPFGKEINLTPDYPHNSTSNPWWSVSNPWRFRHHGFGSICCGRNNELFFITRKSSGHGVGGGRLLWSVSYDEGNTWASPQEFPFDTPADGSEDLRDVSICYDMMTDMYYIVYVHQYNIKQDGSQRYTDYSYIWGEIKVWYGYELFGINSTMMYDISPSYLKVHGTISTEDQPFNRLTQTFHNVVRLGSYLYLPVYGTDYSEGVSDPDAEPIATNPYHTALLRIRPNVNNLSDVAVPVANSWTIVKKWGDNADEDSNETTLYFTYNPLTDGVRFNMLSRKSDLGWITYSDDGGTTWSEKASIGFDVAGGPTVHYIDGVYMLVAREQKLGSRNSYTYALFSEDGANWSKRVFLNNNPTAYCSVAVMRSGKILLCVSKETADIGVQTIRVVNALPI